MFDGVLCCCLVVKPDGRVLLNNLQGAFCFVANVVLCVRSLGLLLL